MVPESRNTMKYNKIRGGGRKKTDAIAMTSGYTVGLIPGRKFPSHVNGYIGIVILVFSASGG